MDEKFFEKNEVFTFFLFYINHERENMGLFVSAILPSTYNADRTAGC
jgi:hypothetical protein